MAFFSKREKTIEDELDPAGIGSIQAAIGLCVLGLVGALMLTPLLNTGPNKPVRVAVSGPGIDRTVTGSIDKKSADKKSGVRRYVVRRSVTHKDPSAPCVVYEGRATYNDC